MKLRVLGRYCMHALSTCDPIRVETIHQHNYNSLVPIYKLVVSNKVLFFIATPQVNWHTVTGFSYGSVLIYILTMRLDLM